MAEFCLECWNKINGTNDPEWKYVLSRDLDICEECGKWKRVIVTVRGPVSRALSEFLHSLKKES